MIVLKKQRFPGSQVQIVVGRCMGISEPLIGELNGNNQVFTTVNNYTSGRISVLYNGQALHSPDDFIETGSNEITFIYIKPTIEDNLKVTYEYEDRIGGVPVSGNDAIAYGSSSHTVVFSTPMATVNYVVYTSITNVIDANLSYYSEIITEKTVNGFTVDFSGNIDSDNYVLEWVVLELFNYAG